VTLIRLIASATEEFERMTGTQIVERTVCLYLNGFESFDIDLQACPVSAITHIKYDDENNAEQTLSASDYYTSLYGACPYVRPVDYWPTTYYNKPDSVRITMTAGYELLSVPEDIRQALKLMVYDGWNNPGDQVSGLTVTSINAIQAIANRHRKYR